MQIRPVNRRAATLAELMVIVVILGVFAAIAVPRLNYAIIRRYKAETTAKKIVAVLRRVRGLALANGATNTVGYSLAMSPPEGAAVRTFYRIRNLDTGVVLDQYTFDPDVSVWSDKMGIRFGPLGNLNEAGGGGYPTEIRVSAEGKIFTIGFVRATGTITCVEN
jgi:Tfp pilus assembly protein FimT